jgi:hypothetical protein
MSVSLNIYRVKEVKIARGYRSEHTRGKPFYTRNIVIVHTEGEFEISLYTHDGDETMPLAMVDEDLVT